MITRFPLLPVAQMTFCSLACCYSPALFQRGRYRGNLSSIYLSSHPSIHSWRTRTLYGSCEFIDVYPHCNHTSVSTSVNHFQNHQYTSCMHITLVPCPLPQSSRQLQDQSRFGCIVRQSNTEILSQEERERERKKNRKRERTNLKIYHIISYKNNAHHR